MENPTLAVTSSDEPQATEIHCPFHLDEEWYDLTSTYVTNVVLIVINTLTALSAIAGNSLILLAVWKTPALRTPSNTLLCCLAFSDFLVGLVVQPTNALEIVFEIQRNERAFCVAEILTTGSLSWICAGVSFLVITAISVERYLAIKLHLRYEELVTNRRILMVVSSFWLVCISLIIARFSGASYDALVIIIVVMDAMSMAITVAAYSKIYLQIRLLQSKTKDQRHLNPSRININTFKRSAVTMLYVLGLFLACFIPFLCALVVKMRRGGGPRLNIIYNFTATIVYLNSSLNPFVYCFRLKDIRIAVFKVLGRKYTIDMNGEQVPVSRSHSNQKLNNLKCSNQNVYIPLSTADISKAPETIV